MCIVNSEIVDSIVKELEIDDIRSASIRQIGAVVRAVEARTGTEFIHFEMGIPGLPPADAHRLPKGPIIHYRYF